MAIATVVVIRKSIQGMVWCTANFHVSGVAWTQEYDVVYDLGPNPAENQKTLHRLGFCKRKCVDLLTGLFSYTLYVTGRSFASFSWRDRRPTQPTPVGVSDL